MEKNIYEKIIKKKEFSDLPKKDVEKVWSLFERRQTSDEDKIKLTRYLLRKVYFAFGSNKLLNPKIIDKKGVDEILKKHISTRERFDFYAELYKKLLAGFKGEISVIDLGAGINGLSYNYFEQPVNYLGIEAVGQLVDLMNYHFKTRGIENSGAVKGSLFDLEKIKKMISQLSKERIVFLFKAVDSLEMVERNFSKKLLSEIVPLVDKVVVSFATRSLISGKKFNVKRYWFENFVKEDFNLIEKFELGNELYFILKNR